MFEERISAPVEGDGPMKRFSLLIATLFIISIFTSSPLLASPPLFEKRGETFISIFHQYIILLVGNFHGYREIPGIDNGDRDEKLGGDADDYANGRDGATGDGKKNSGKLNSGLPDWGAKSRAINILRAY
jgi:hypothetical protein